MSSAKRDRSVNFKCRLFLILAFACLFTASLYFWKEKDVETIEKITYKSNIVDSQISNNEATSKEEKEKILISVNMGGPNNQIWGLREGLFLSQLMNRTFVAPLFFRHFTTGGHFSSYPSVFIDTDNLSSLDKKYSLPLP